MTTLPQTPHVPPLTAAQREAVELLRGAKRVLLTGHERPDGDCVGAQAALTAVLRAVGVESIIVNPGLPEAQYDYLASRVRYHDHDPGAPLPEHDLAVLLDCSELSRCGALGAALADHPSRKVVIDHHIHPGEPWWDAAFQDVSCAATGLLVRRIALEWGLPVDDLMAHGVFTSLVTDTGWFKYSNTDAETLSAAAELVSAGLEPASIYRAIYQRRSPELPARVARVLQDLEYHADGRLAVVTLPLGQDGRPPELDSDEVLDLLRSVEPVEVVLFLRQVDPATCKLSARSKTGYDVQRLAARFGGGGHAKAAGATLTGGLSEVRERLVQAAVEAFGAEGADGEVGP